MRNDCLITSDWTSAWTARSVAAPVRCPFLQGSRTSPTGGTSLATPGTGGATCSKYPSSSACFRSSAWSGRSESRRLKVERRILTFRRAQRDAFGPRQPPPQHCLYAIPLSPPRSNQFRSGEDRSQEGALLPGPSVGHGGAVTVSDDELVEGGKKMQFPGATWSYTNVRHR